MNRWQALVEIVKSFNERGHPAFALASVGLIVATVVALAALPLLRFS